MLARGFRERRRCARTLSGILLHVESPAPPIEDCVVLPRKRVQDDVRPWSLLAKAPRHVHLRILRPHRQFLAAWEEFCDLHP